jgi:nitric oxide reductase large subunit
MCVSNKIDKKTVKKGLLPYVFLAIIMLGVFYVFNVLNKEVHEFTYDEFWDVLLKHNYVQIIPE